MLILGSIFGSLHNKAVYCIHWTEYNVERKLVIYCLLTDPSKGSMGYIIQGICTQPYVHLACILLKSKFKIYHVFKSNNANELSNVHQKVIVIA